jgi:hypothetical protein
MQAGEEWAYRVRSHAPSERVRVLEIERRKQSTRAVVEFLDDARSGRVENVPVGRLRVPWSEVAAFDALMANWQRIDGYKLSQAEEHAVGVVFERLIPDDVADYDTGGAQNGREIKDDRALEMLVNRSVRRGRRPGNVDDVEQAIARLHGLTHDAVRQAMWRNLAGLVQSTRCGVLLPRSVRVTLAAVH